MIPVSDGRNPTRADYCAVACAEAFRGDGEIMVSPMGFIPRLGARLARRTFEPDLLLSDGEATLQDEDGATEGWMPFADVFETLWSGKRHVMMGGAQIDRHGNQNISCVGDWNRPKAQLIGTRGAPGNTINHPTSYFIGRHSKRVFVPSVDVVCGLGYDRAAELGAAARFHEIRRVVTNLGVFDFEQPDGVATLRLRSLHPGVSVDDVVEATGFVVRGMDRAVPGTRTPSPAELDILDALDPSGRREREVAT
jgi:acyl CoA:acetate/3-ketoacid CoA transferase beta subunit